MNELMYGRGLNKSESAINTVKLMLENETLKQQNKVLLEYAQLNLFGYTAPWILVKDVRKILENLRDR